MSAPNGFTVDGFDGSGCTYPTSVKFTYRYRWYSGSSWNYDVVTNGVLRRMRRQGDSAFWYGVNCQLGYRKNQTVYFEMTGTNIFGQTNHAGTMFKSSADPSVPSYHGEGPIFWGPGTTDRPRIQIERFALNTPGKTQAEAPWSVTQEDFPRGAPLLRDGVTYRVWVDANLDGVQVWVLDPFSNVHDRSTWLANFSMSWSSLESVSPFHYGIAFFAIPAGTFNSGATLEFAKIQIDN